MVQKSRILSTTCSRSLIKKLCVGYWGLLFLARLYSQGTNVTGFVVRATKRTLNLGSLILRTDKLRKSNGQNVVGMDAVDVMELLSNKPVGDWTSRLAQISLPWQQGAAPQYCAWFH